ncbi:MAG: putative dsRNA-binding protein, partial [Candidatus Adiutrix sp.]
ADYKTRLQEETQKGGHGAPKYELIKTEGPPHARFFTMAVNLAGEQLALGTAPSKKEAEQQAAKQALDILLNRPKYPIAE